MADRFTIEISLDGKDNVSQHLSKVNEGLDKLQKQGQEAGDATKSISSGFDDMAQSINGWIASYGLMKIGEKVIELGHLGAEVEAANRVFTELAGGPKAAADGLDKLRSSTSGVVDDLTLMRGANQLLLTGLAQTTDEAAGLTEVAVKLGGAMGQGAAEAIDNLNSALLNNSFPRLDTLGISAANVRARVEELKQSGMDMSAAFSQAVLEQGRLALERLGPAANTSATAVNVLATQWENLQQQVGGFLNTALEAGAQLAIIADIQMGGSGGIPEVEARIQKMEELNTLASQYKDQILSLDSSVDPRLGRIDPEKAAQITEYIVANPEIAAQFTTAGEDAGTYFRDAFSSGNSELIAEARTLLQEVTDFDYSDWTDSELGAQATAMDVGFTASANAVRDLRVETDAMAESQARQAAQTQAQTAALTDFSVLEAQAVDNVASLRTGFQSLSASFDEGFFTSGSNSFFDPDAVGDVRSQAEALADEYERLKSIAESSDYTLVSEIEVERAREIAANANSMATDAERMATAFDNMSLSQIAGEGDGGQLGQFFDSVLAQLEDPDLKAAAESQFNLASGERTANGDVLDYGANLVTQITEEQGIAAGQRAGVDFVTAFKDGIAAGMSGEELKTYVEEQVGYALDGDGTGTGGGQDVTVQAGEGYIALAQRTGVSREDLEAANGGGQMLMAGQVIHLGDGTSLIAVGEGESPENIANNILGKAFGTALSTPNEPTAAYTYIDPATGTLTNSNNPEMPAADEPLVSDEEVMAVASIEEDMISIQTSMTEISAIDTSAALDPMATDVAAANTDLASFETALSAIAASTFRVGVALAPYLDFANIPELAGNPAFLELFATVIRNNPAMLDVGGN